MGPTATHTPTSIPEFVEIWVPGLCPGGQGGNPTGGPLKSLSIGSLDSLLWSTSWNIFSPPNDMILGKFHRNHSGPRSPLNHMVALGSGNPPNALNNSGLGIIGETLPRMIETVFGVGVAHPNPHACAWDIPRCTTQKKNYLTIFQFKTHLPQKHHWEDHDDLVAVAMHQKMPWSWQNWEPCIEKELFRVAVQHKKGFTHRLHSQKNERIAAWTYRIPKLGNYS